MTGDPEQFDKEQDNLPDEAEEQSFTASDGRVTGDFDR